MQTYLVNPLFKSIYYFLKRSMIEMDENSSKDEIRIPVNQLSDGNDLLTITTEKYRKTARFVIQYSGCKWIISR